MRYKEIIATLAACCACISCMGNIYEIKIEDKVFHIPKENLILSTDDGFHVVLNPRDSLQNQRRVLVKTLDRECISFLVDNHEYCRPRGEYISRSERLIRRGDDIFWRYVPESGTVPVAYCYAMASPGSGWCTAFGRYGNLDFEFGLADGDIGNLGLIRQQIETLLSGWDR